MNIRALRYHFDRIESTYTKDNCKFTRRTRYTTPGALLVKGHLSHHLSFTLNDDGTLKSVERYTLQHSTTVQMREAGLPMYTLRVERATQQDRDELTALLALINRTPDFWSI